MRHYLDSMFLKLKRLINKYYKLIMLAIFTGLVGFIQQDAMVDHNVEAIALCGVLVIMGYSILFLHEIETLKNRMDKEEPVDVPIIIQGGDVMPDTLFDSNMLNLYANTTELIIIAPNTRKTIPTGISIKPPEGYEFIIGNTVWASGTGVIALNVGERFTNTRHGEVYITLYNSGIEPLELKPGDVVANMTLVKTELINFNPVNSFN